MDPANVPERRPDRRTARELYTHGYGERVVGVMAGRSLTGNLGFLLPHLQPGMRVLDCGCGPGSITADVAEFVAPGQVIGVDIEPSQVEAARRRAEERGLANARFEVSSLYELPFPDANTTSGQPGRSRTRCEPVVRLTSIRFAAAPPGHAGLAWTATGSSGYEKVVQCRSRSPCSSRSAITRSARASALASASSRVAP